MARKSVFTIGIVIVFLMLIVTANALPKVFPGLSLPNFNFNSDQFKLQDPPLIVGWTQKNDYIIITYAPSGNSWSGIDKTDSTCTLPTGEINAGDKITNCQGIIILTHKKSNSIFIETEFRNSNTPKDPNTNNNNNNNDQPTAQETNIPPTIDLTKPIKNSHYLRNLKRLGTHKNTIILGYIDIEVLITNPSNTEIGAVHFYIDGQLKYEGKEAPYTWRWNEKVIGKTTIETKLIAPDGTEIDSDSVEILATNLKLK